MSIKKILFLLFAVTLFCCCSSDDGDESNLSGFEKYEGTWGPVAYTIKGKEHLCNPEYPDINNIPRLVFLKWRDNEVIIRSEYYYNGEWKHGSDMSYIWHNGGFYKVKTEDGKNIEMGEPYTDIVISGDILYRQSDPGTKFKKVK